MLSQGRFRLLLVALGVWALAVVGRLVQVQLVEHDRWEYEAARQREKTVEVEEPRGDILTRDGRLLAGSLELAAVYANPTQIARERWGSVAQQLAGPCGLPAADILKGFQEHEGFHYVAKGLDPSVAQVVTRLRERGVGTLRLERRVYPHGELAGPVVGFVDGDGVGRAGLESFYDRTLAGTPSVYRILRDGKTSPTALELRLEKQGRPGQTLCLTLDSRIQHVVEEELRRTITEIGARSASAVVLDVVTGEVMAMASLPAYDPGNLAATPAEYRHNHTIEDILEPGSTFKPFIVAAAITGGYLSPFEMVDCSGGGVQIAGVFMHDHASYGSLSVRDMLAKSSNTGAIHVAQRVPPEELDRFITSLGFGQPTRVGLPAEARGLYRGVQHWSALSRAGMALGQEIGVTALQLARAYAAIANGGLLLQPALVVETRDAGGQVVAPARPPAPVRVMSRELATTLAGLLEGVTEDGTGKAARVAGYRVGGKTGTAQKAAGGGYAQGRHAAWFAGFLPQPTSRFVMVVCVDEPEATYWAADVAAPAFGRIADRLVLVLAIPPTEVKKV
jgi:cell division protein FtsI (penicillin-binding protein 3)